MLTFQYVGYMYSFCAYMWAYAAYSGENPIESLLLLGTSPLDWLLNGALWLLILRFIVWPFVIVPILDWLDFRRQQTIETVVFEVVPHQMVSVSAEATAELFRIMHAQYATASYVNRLLRRKNCIALEIVASRSGLHYRVQIPASNADLFRRMIRSLQPEIEIRQVRHDMGVTQSGYSAIETFRQLNPLGFSLRNHTALETHDPVAYLTGALANPKMGETLMFQMVLASCSGLRRAVFRHGNSVKRSVVIYGRRIQRSAVSDKLQEPLFYTDIRLYSSTRTKAESAARLAAVAGALATFDALGNQRLVPSSKLQGLLVRAFKVVSKDKLHRLQEREFQKVRQRLPSLFTVNSNILSASEIAGLYHFPYKHVLTTEGLSRSTSRMLAVPNAIKHHADKGSFDLILGENTYNGNRTPIGLTADERQRHIYIIGGTGNGKTAMLEYGIVQDMRSGKGVAVIDPHGDSARRLLRYIPRERLKDVIYFNPRDYDYPIGLNLLELPRGLSGSALAHEKDVRTEAVISVLNKVFDEENGNAYRIERILRNAIQTAFTIEDGTLFTVLKLLTESSYRKQIAYHLKDDRLRRFWIEEFGKAGDMQRVKLALGPITRLERFEASESVRRILGQPVSTINFDEIINGGKILICNFSKGSLGEDTSTLLGTTVLAELQLAAWRREKLPREDRRPFYVYVDEFQNFANDAFTGFFSEARKYGLSVTMAQQSLSQLKDQSLLNTILDNAGTVIAFRSKSRMTADLILHQFKPHIQHADIINLPSYNFYTKIAATTSVEPLSGRTIVLPREDADEALAREAVRLSRRHYSIGVKHIAGSS